MSTLVKKFIREIIRNNIDDFLDLFMEVALDNNIDLFIKENYDIDIHNEKKIATMRILFKINLFLWEYLKILVVFIIL